MGTHDTGLAAQEKKIRSVQRTSRERDAMPWVGLRCQKKEKAGSECSRGRNLEYPGIRLIPDMQPLMNRLKEETENVQGSGFEKQKLQGL